jgi:hypothetical protein
VKVVLVEVALRAQTDTHEFLGKSFPRQRLAQDLTRPVASRPDPIGPIIVEVPTPVGKMEDRLAHLEEVGQENLLEVPLRIDPDRA